MSFYESDTDLRVEKWRQAIRRGRLQLDCDSWRRYFVVVVDGEPAPMQRWRLRREVWQRLRRDDIQLAGADTAAGGHRQAAEE